MCSSHEEQQVEFTENVEIHIRPVRVFITRKITGVAWFTEVGVRSTWRCFWMDREERLRRRREQATRSSQQKHLSNEKKTVQQPHALAT